MKAKSLWLGVLGVLLVAGSLSAQERERPRPETDEADDELSERVPDPDQTGRPIRFRANPYDNAGHYYYGGSAYGRGYFGYVPSRSFGYDSYRDRQWGRSYGYMRFWANGYSARHPGYRRMRYRRQIGENGDLVLLAPFLAPLGPLADGR